MILSHAELNEPFYRRPHPHYPPLLISTSLVTRRTHTHTPGIDRWRVSCRGAAGLCARRVGVPGVRRRAGGLPVSPPPRGAITCFLFFSARHLLISCSSFFLHPLIAAEYDRFLSHLFFVSISLAMRRAQLTHAILDAPSSLTCVLQLYVHGLLETRHNLLLPQVLQCNKSVC